MAEKILGKESAEWFDKSKREVELLEKYFNERTKIEKGMEIVWKSFSTDWKNRFEDHIRVDFPHPMWMALASKHPTALIMKELIEELKENARICSKVTGLLMEERQSPSGILKRWLLDPLENTTCVGEEKFKNSYDAAVRRLEKKNGNVEKAKQTMSELHKSLESYEKNRLSVLHRALDSFGTTMNECEAQRVKRKQCLKDLAGVVDKYYGSSVEQTVKKWLDSIQQTIKLPVYEDDPLPPEIEKADDIPPSTIKVISVVSKSSGEKTNEQIAHEPELEDVECVEDLDSDNVDNLDINNVDDGGKTYGLCPVKKEMLMEEPDTGNRPTDVSMAAHVHVYAMESYTDISSDHLSFSTGQKIKQKKAADEDGLCYGYIVSNKYTRQRKYGFYPSNIVCLKVPSKKRRLKHLFRKK